MSETARDRLGWWRRARFGVFVHWGVYAQWAGSYHGHRQRRGGAEWIMNRCKIGVEEYRERAAGFDAAAYDPEQWARTIAASGAGYAVITAKHHDGFALFDSAVSDWTAVRATQAAADLLRPFLDACRRHDLRVGVYYSHSQDWVNPGGAAARKESIEGWDRPDADHIDAFTAENDGHWDPAQLTATFDEYLDGIALPQVRELLSDYGPISVLWWDTPMSITSEQAARFDRLLALQPGILTNDRLRRPDFPGDTASPEQHVPDESEGTARAWETCLTMNGSWGYNAADHDWKSSTQLIRTLVDCVSKDGNLLLNVGPRADGSFPEESVRILAEIGDWMSLREESIRNCGSVDLPAPSWGRLTGRRDGDDTLVYVHVFDWPEGGSVRVDGLTAPVTSSRVLGADVAVGVSASARETIVTVPASGRDSSATVVELRVAAPVLPRRAGSAGAGPRSGSLDA